MESGRQVLVFMIGPHRACFALEEVVQVYDAVSYEPVSGTHPSVMGMINIRGQMAPLIDIRPRWQLNSYPIDLSEQIVVFQCHGITVSIIVDKVIGTRTIPAQKIISLASLVEENFPHYVIATPEGIISLLTCDDLFSKEFLAPFELAGATQENTEEQV